MKIEDDVDAGVGSDDHDDNYDNSNDNEMDVLSNTSAVLSADSLVNQAISSHAVVRIEPLTVDRCSYILIIQLSCNTYILTTAVSLVIIVACCYYYSFINILYSP